MCFLYQIILHGNSSLVCVFHSKAVRDVIWIVKSVCIFVKHSQEKYVFDLYVLMELYGQFFFTRENYNFDSNWNVLGINCLRKRTTLPFDFLHLFMVCLVRKPLLYDTQNSEVSTAHAYNKYKTKRQTKMKQRHQSHISYQSTYPCTWKVEVCAQTIKHGFHLALTSGN